MFETRLYRVLFSIIVGAVITELLRAKTGAEVNMLFFIIPINYTIIGIRYFKKNQVKSKTQQQVYSEDEILDRDLE